MQHMGSILGGRLTSVVAMSCFLLASCQTSVAAELIRSVGSGRWTAGATWEGGKPPGAGVKVQIREGHIVVYDRHSDEVIRSLHVRGTLTFATDRDTRLDVGLIRITPGDSTEEEGFNAPHPVKKKLNQDKADSALPGFTASCLCCDGKAAVLVGTPEQPIGAKHTALIRLHYVAGMNKESCPAIVCCGGRLDLHGAPLSRTWVKLGATAQAGDERVVLDERVTGWKVGDRILLTGSSGNFSGSGPQTETRQITAVQDSQLTLDRPLEYTHSGAGNFRAEVANLSRNVVVESADPKGIRGHTMYHADSAGSISYAEFRHLGKQGVLGRYALHYHLCRDTMRGSSVVGASIWDSHNRWLTIHGTEYLVVRDCVGDRSIGHGFFLEDGTEVYNVFDRNLAVRAEAGEPLKDQALPFDKNEGAGFWWANSHNTFTRNVAADCAGYGFRYEATPRAGFKNGDKTFGAPTQTFDLTLPVLRSDGSRAPVDIRTLPFVRFESNTAHNIANYGLNLGQDAGVVGPDKDHPFVVRDMKIWNAQRGYTVHVPHVRIDGLHIDHCGYEIYRARYHAQDYRNVQLMVRGSIRVSNLKEYLASGKQYLTKGKAVDAAETGLNRARLPGFPRGVGAGGTAYQEPDYEVAVLEPIDDLPPITAITHVRVEGTKLLVRGTTTDNGIVKKVLVNGVAARALSANFGEWEAVVSVSGAKPLTVAAHAVDDKGNVEKRTHQIRIALR